MKIISILHNELSTYNRKIKIFLIIQVIHMMFITLSILKNAVISIYTAFRK